MFVETDASSAFGAGLADPTREVERFDSGYSLYGHFSPLALDMDSLLLRWVEMTLRNYNLKIVILSASLPYIKYCFTKCFLRSRRKFNAEGKPHVS